MGSVDDVPSRRGRLSPQHGSRAFTFITPSGLLAKGLAHMLHSLVRVSRRVGRGRPNTSSTGAQVTLSDRGSTVTVSTARSPPSTARPRREAPPYGVHHTGQKLPSFLGRSGAPGSQSVSCRAGKPDPTYRPSSLMAPLQPPLVRAREEYGSASGRRQGTLWSPRRHLRQNLSLRNHCTNLVRFPPNGFTYCLTLFSKCFSSFPHGTCSLSVSCQYLALDGVYHPFWAAIPNNPTLWAQILPSAVPPHTGLSPSLARLSRTTLGTPRRAKLALQTTIRRCRHRRFQI